MNILIKLFLLIIRHLTNLSLAWFDPIRPQDFIIVDQSSALLACDLCGESEMTMSDVGEKMAGRSFWGCREMVNSPLSAGTRVSPLLQPVRASRVYPFVKVRCESRVGFRD